MTDKRIIKSFSLKIEPMQYIAMFYDGSIFNETDVCSAFKVRIKTRQIAIAVSGIQKLFFNCVK